MGRKQIAAMGIVGVLLGAGSLLAPAAGASVGAAPTGTGTTARRAVCRTTTDDKWPAWTNGRPASVDPKTASGVYMWHDGSGWHIRATHRGDARRTFSGRLETTGRFVGVSSVRLEGHDSRNVSADHHVITFRFENHGAIDGLNFRTLCAPAISFAFDSDGTVLAPSDVTIGHDGSKPTTDPFSIARS